MRRTLLFSLILAVFLALNASEAWASIPGTPTPPRRTQSQLVAHSGAEQDTTVIVIPQFTYAAEFYSWPLAPESAQVQPQRTSHRASVQRVKMLGNRITSRLHHWTSAVWPL